jgi:hypothetical protein
MSLAAHADLRQELEKNGSAYVESFNKQDAAGIAALYAIGGLHVNAAAGPRRDIAEFYRLIFEAGFNHQEVSVDEVWALGAETALAMGHVWTAPGWQGESSRCSIGRSSHVFGLFARFT